MVRPRREGGCSSDVSDLSRLTSADLRGTVWSECMDENSACLLLFLLNNLVRNIV